MDQPTIELRPIAQLKRNPRNPRRHTEKQIEQIADSIRSFGFNNPVLIDRDGMIIAGHGRAAAAERLGTIEVPTLLIDHLDEAQKRAYVIADNRLAELAGWDREILGIELQNLVDAEIDFEVTDVGFEAAEIDLLLCDASATADVGRDDEQIPAVQQPTVAAPGDLWLIGGNRLLCGDALLPSSYEMLMGTERARMVFADPPYNVRVSSVAGRGATKYREFIMASGEMSQAKYTRFLSTGCQNMAAATVDGALHYICMDWRHAHELLRAGRIAYSELMNIVVWAKTAGGMGSMYRSQHELIFLFRSGTARHVNNVLLGRYGRNRTNVWNYAGLNTFQQGRAEALARHPTTKPVGLIADAILDCTRRSEIVLDPFVGSGSSIIAALRTGRRCYAMELDPQYVDVALRRVRQLTGIEPTHASSGEAFRDREATVLEEAGDIG
jgi:DNA modification methylase